MGAVYEATQLSLSRTVALKLFDEMLGDDASLRERFRREARIQGRLDHPHIVTVHEAGELPEGLYIAMRLVRGSDLKAIARAETLDPQRALRILAPIADALDFAHESGLTHRDVKPQNILVGRNDHPYLADFGLTKAQGDTGFTRTGQFLGTLDYVAPEQIEGVASRESDLYAFAVVAFECLTGRLPFVKATEAALIWAHLNEHPPMATTVRPELPPGVDAILERGLAKQAADRPATAVSFVRDLQEAASLRSAPAPSAGITEPRAPSPEATRAHGAAASTVRRPARAVGAQPAAGSRPTERVMQTGHRVSVSARTIGIVALVIAVFLLLILLL